MTVRAANPARIAAETAARTAYGRLLALLTRHTRDPAAAEDALAEALARALARWPADGVPNNPEAWLFTVARRHLGAGRGRLLTALAAEPALALIAEERADPAESDLPDANIPDERLTLMFVCTHPAISPRVQAPLMLQLVLGLDAARIAQAFMVSPAAMGQALVRAKARIRDAGIPFAVPPPDQRLTRLAAIRTAIYAAYGAGHEAIGGDDAAIPDLAAEALFLARLLASLNPGDPETLGLLALIALCEARRPARRDPHGGFVPLDRQNPRLWLEPLIRQGEAALRDAARHARPGRFQLEAAIQSLHNHQIMTGADLSAPLLALYAQLLSVAPSIGAAVAHAAALVQAGQAAAALAALDALAQRCQAHQPWWAARARALAALGDSAAARAATTRAAGLASDPAVRAFLLDQA